MLRNQSAIAVSDTVDDRPPAFQAAIGTNSTANAIPLATSLPADSRDVNINLYFAEMQQLGLNDRRDVQVTMDGAVISESMAVPVQDVLEYQIYDGTANATTSFTVQAAIESTLPPSISAMEVFSVEDRLQATDSSDGESDLG